MINLKRNFSHIRSRDMQPVEETCCYHERISQDVLHEIQSREEEHKINAQLPVSERVQNLLMTCGCEEKISLNRVEEHFMKQATDIQTWMVEVKRAVDEPLEVLENLDVYKRLKRLVADCFMSRAVMLNLLAFVFTQGPQYDEHSGPLSTEWQKWTKANCVPHVPRLVFQSEDRNVLNSYQQLLAVMYDELQLRNYKRVGEECVSMLHTPDGHPTQFWKPVSTIKEFVYSQCSMQFQFENWRNATIGDNVNKVINALKGAIEPRFAEMTRNRNFMSFKNGVYDVPNDEFYLFPSSSVPIPNKDSTCVYHDITFPSDAHVQTPALDKILHFQEMDEDVKEWFYALCIGRMLYNLNDKDHWQVMALLLGAAQSGKSTVLNYVVGRMYQDIDIGVLSNNHERQFGLHPLKDKFVIIAPEIDSETKLDQTEWQCMVAGERISAAKKHGDPCNLEWKAPIVMAGNTQPNYNDNSGSYTRRTILFDFKKSVQEANTYLKYELYGELGHIIAKCNRIYLRKVRDHGKRNIWKCLPQYFIDLQRQLQEDQNSLVSFLRSGNVYYGNDRYVSKSDFISAYRDYCKAHMKEYKRWDQTTNKAVLAQHTVYESMGNVIDKISGCEISGRYFGNCALASELT